MDNGLRTKLLFEISQIDRLISNYKPLLDLCNLKTPNYIEISAAAMLSHSFYNGIENILILIFKSYDEELPNGNKWHIELLDKAFISNKDRPQIFKSELQELLEEYLKFRHFIRHAYGFQFEWSMMEDLIKRIDNVWMSVREDINRFIENN